MLLEHVPDGQVAPRVGAGLVTVLVGVLEERAERVGVLRGLGHRAGVGHVPVGVGDVFGHALDPPHVRYGGLLREVALQVVAAVQGVGVLVVEVPDAGGEAVVAVLVGERDRLVGGAGRVADQVDAAVVGAHAVDSAGVGLVVLRGGEDHHLQRVLVLAGDRAVVLDQVVDEAVLVLQAGADGGQVGRGQTLGEDAVSRVAGVTDRQRRGLELLRQVADAVEGAVGRVVVGGHPGDADPERGGRAGDRGDVHQALDQRADGGYQGRVLDEPGGFQAGVGLQEGVAGAQQILVVQRETVQCDDQTRVCGHCGDVGRVLVAAEDRGVHGVDEVHHVPGGVVRAVVAVEHLLVRVDVAGLEVGAVAEDHRLAADLAVAVADIGEVRAGDEGVEAGLHRAGERGVVGTDIGGVVVLHVVPGLKEVLQLVDASGVVAGVGGGGALEAVGHRDHLALLEHPGGVAAGGEEERADAVLA